MTQSPLDLARTIRSAVILARSLNRDYVANISFAPDALALARDKTALVAWSAAEALTRLGPEALVGLGLSPFTFARALCDEVAFTLATGVSEEELSEEAQRLDGTADDYAHETYCEVPAWLSCERARCALEKLINDSLRLKTHTKKVTP